MLGVVIWSCKAESKAIIWCEDHGNLAYFGSTPHAAASTQHFGEGDLIQFDLSEHRNMRLAHNPRKIAGHYCSDLKDVIAQAAQVKSEIETRQNQTSPAPRPAPARYGPCEAVVNLERARRLRRTG